MSESDWVAVEKYSEEYENPDGSVWVIGVDIHGNLSIVGTPNVWDGFYSETCIEYNGFPPDAADLTPGLYRVTVKFKEWKEPDTWLGEGEDVWEFEPVKWEPIYTFGDERKGA